MSKYTSFAVLGAGGLGEPLIASLLSKPNATVVLLSRSAATVVPAGATVRVVDYATPSTIFAALKDVEVVVSTLGPGTSAAQIAVADAAKEAGVKLFVPSEYGADTRALEPDQDDHLYVKKQFHKHLEELGLPYVLTFVGLWTTYIKYLEWDLKNGTVNIVGDGNSKITFTHNVDTADFLGHVLTTLPPTKLNNLVLKIEGDKKTLNEVVDIYNATHEKKLVRTYESVEHAKAFIKSEKPSMQTFMKYLQVRAAAELNDQTKNGGLTLDLYPGWKPKSVKDIVSQY